MQGVVLTIDRSWEPVACQTWLGPIVTPVPGPPSGAAEIVRVVPATDTVWVRTTRDARVRAVRLTLAAIAAASVAPGLSRPSWLTGLLAQGQALGK
ncbi:MAG: hypothetical protein K6U14_03740 [Firmicutes bacterium]|nr:hypothetical protein [Alicyclobacillaceae bacterium]MCL6496733.1 hypothetical protein [Bacillota bacterium]